MVSIGVVVRLVFLLLLLLSVTVQERSGMRLRVTAVTAPPQPSSGGWQWVQRTTAAAAADISAAQSGIHVGQQGSPAAILLARGALSHKDMAANNCSTLLSGWGDWLASPAGQHFEIG